MKIMGQKNTQKTQASTPKRSTRRVNHITRTRALVLRVSATPKHCPSFIISLMKREVSRTT